MSLLPWAGTSASPRSTEDTCIVGYLPPFFCAKAVRSVGGGDSRSSAPAVLAMTDGTIVDVHLFSRGRAGGLDRDVLDDGLGSLGRFLRLLRHRQQGKGRQKGS